MKQRSDDAVQLNEQIIERMERYCSQLLATGMKEPDRQSKTWHWMFYRLETELTAFAVNLQGREDCVEIVYGFASVAFLRMDGQEPSQAESITIDDTDIAIRKKEIVRSPEDEQRAGERIRAFYEAYRSLEKDALLAEKKARQKKFLDTIAVRLKPLGFKKKAARWTRQLRDGFALEFYAQKSAFSDEYYFNVSVGKIGDPTYGSCFYTRVTPKGMRITDWQLIPEADWEAFLDSVIENTLKPLMATPFEELGRQERLWENCNCARTKCAQCWVEKNLWEAKGMQ